MMQFNKTTANVQRNQGFSLIELMITLVIIGILAAFALPSYTKYTMRAARSEGQQHALAIMAAQERYYLEHAAYTDDLQTLGYGSKKPASETGYFTAEAGTCTGGLSLGQCVRVTLKAKKPLAADLITALGGKDIWLQSNGQRSDTWEKPIN